MKTKLFAVLVVVAGLTGALHAGNTDVSFWQAGKTGIALTHLGSGSQTCSIFYYDTLGSLVGTDSVTLSAPRASLWRTPANASPSVTSGWGSARIECPSAAIAHSYYYDGSGQHGEAIVINGGNPF